MKNEKLFELIGEIDEKYVKEACVMKEGQKNKIKVMKWLGGIVAVLVISVILPNINGSIALAMENIPILGKYFQIVTFREYHYEDTNNEANVSVPKIETEEDTKIAETINKSVEEYAESFITKFEENLKTEGEGYQGLDIGYEVVTDNEEWLTLKVFVVETAASGYEQSKFYHVDKNSGKEIELSDLFRDGADYIHVISENIIRQMKEQMEADEGKVYFFQGSEEDLTGVEDTCFSEIEENQKFYFNEKQELVIVFDEYEVAPGYMGSVEFTIPLESVQGILK